MLLVCTKFFSGKGNKFIHAIYFCAVLLVLEVLSVSLDRRRVSDGDVRGVPTEARPPHPGRPWAGGPTPPAAGAARRPCWSFCQRPACKPLVKRLVSVCMSPSCARCC